MCISRQYRERGVTLIELILFIVIVGVAVGGILGVLAFTTKHSADPLRRKQALMIAEALLEEVELAQFTYCEPGTPNSDTAINVAACAVPENFGRDGVESRPYDNINDYGGVAAPFNNAGGALADINGTALPVAGYSASLSVVPETLGGIAGGTPDDPDVLRITVTVSYDNGQSVSLDGYRTRYAPQVQ
jgi:MSHA pilin protein MshD